MSKIGISKFHYAKQTSEEVAGTPGTPAVYGTVKAVPGLVSIDVSVASNTATLYADNGPYETASSLGEISLTLNLADLPLDVQADLLGHTLDSTDTDSPQITKKASDVAPYVAVMFEFLLGDGTKRCVKLYKGKFAIPNENGQTRGENVEFQTSEITAAFVQLKNSQVYEDIKDFPASESTDSWYASVLS